MFCSGDCLCVHALSIFLNRGSLVSGLAVLVKELHRRALQASGRQQATLWTVDANLHDHKSKPNSDLPIPSPHLVR